MIKKEKVLIMIKITLVDGIPCQGCTTHDETETVRFVCHLRNVVCRYTAQSRDLRQMI